MDWPISPGRYAAGSPGSEGLFADIIGELSIVSAIASNQYYIGNAPNIPNGSFESDAVGTVSPTGWIATAVGSGSGQVTNTQQYHGNNSYLAIQPNSAGNGGMILTSSVFPVSAGAAFDLDVSLLAQFTGTEAKISIGWYGTGTVGPGTLISNQSLIDIFPVLTAWTPYTVRTIGPPNLAVQAVLTAQLGTTAHIPASSTDIYIDNIQCRRYTPFTNFVDLGSSGSFTVPQGIALIHVIMAGGTQAYEAFIPVTPGNVLSWDGFGDFGPYSIGDATFPFPNVFLVAGSNHCLVYW